MEAPEELYFWQSKEHELDFVLSSGEFLEVKHGRTSPVEFAWFSKVSDSVGGGYTVTWPSSSSHCLVLVLYMDGNLRLIPHPPEGMARVCFGSSVIVGSGAPHDDGILMFPGGEGTDWLFHREIRSRHNTSAPDIRLRTD